MSEQVYIGIDLGGTSVKIGICNHDGHLLYKYEGPTEVDKGTEQIIDNIEQYVKKFTSESGYTWDQIAGIGMGVAGFLDIPRGFVKLSANLGLKNVPLKEILEQRFDKEVVVNNDANVAALGEAWSGAGKGIKNVVCFTLGTGVGGGVIINGQIYEGLGVAGEVGHLSVVPDLEAIQCGCGQVGCLETVSSATGIIRMARDAVARGELAVLSELDSIMAKDVFDAAKNGDESAKRIIQRAAFYLGKSMAMVAIILNPQRFVIGGGVSKAGDILFDPIREAFARYTPEATRDDVDIVPAVLGNDAGIIGAAGLLLRA